MEEKQNAKQNKDKKKQTPLPVLTEAEIKAAARAPEGGYFLYGDEDYLKNHYVAAIRAAALGDSPVPELNSTYFDDDNYDPATLGEAIATLPMMGSRRFVMLRLADVSGMKDAEFEDMIGAVSSLREYPETVFVLYAEAGGFDAGKPKEPTARARALSDVLKLAPVRRDRARSRDLAGCVVGIRFDAQAQFPDVGLFLIYNIVEQPRCLAYADGQHARRVGIKRAAVADLCAPRQKPSHLQHRIGGGHSAGLKQVDKAVHAFSSRYAQASFRISSNLSSMRAHRMYAPDAAVCPPPPNRAARTETSVSPALRKEIRVPSGRCSHRMPMDTPSISFK